jgi:DNA-directed RNA polymerase subunit M/transcription elongation factor TFIIS
MKKLNGISDTGIAKIGKIVTQAEKRKRCVKCGGWMYLESDPNSEVGGLVWRCANCDYVGIKYKRTPSTEEKEYRDRINKTIQSLGEPLSEDEELTEDEEIQ